MPNAYKTFDKLSINSMKRTNTGGLEKSFKIILIAFYDVDSFGTRILHHFLSNAGYSVKAIFFKRLSTSQSATPEEMGLLLKFLREQNPDLIGISLRSSFFQLGIQVTKLIKENTDATVIWGGTHPTISPEDSIQIADMVCVGEGEAAIVEVADCLKNGILPLKVRNIWVNDGKGIVKNPVRPPIDVNAVLFPDWKNTNKYFIDDNKLYDDCDPELTIYKKKYYPIMASRGCPYSCTYCCNNVLKKIYPSNYIRKRSISNLMEELTLAKEKHPHLEMIQFSDDMMVTDEKWLEDFVKEYKKNIALPFKCQFIPIYVKEPVISALKAGGMSKVVTGIQSGSERVRKEIFKRSYTNDRIITNAILFKKYKLDIDYDFIVNNPFETYEETKMTLNLLCKLPTPFNLRLYSLAYFPHTELTQLALDNGVIRVGDVEGSSEKSLEWRLVFDSTNNKEKMVYNNLIALTAVDFVPRRLILFLSRNKMVKKHPGILIYARRFVNASRKVKRGMYYLFIKGDVRKIMTYIKRVVAG